MFDLQEMLDKRLAVLKRAAEISAKDIVEVQPMIRDTKKVLKDALATSELVEVIFTKKDGTDRRMICSLNGRRIPAEHRPKPLTVGDKIFDNLQPVRKPHGDHVQPVFDVEKQDWRSIIFESIKSVTPVTDEALLNTYWYDNSVSAASYIP